MIRYLFAGVVAFAAAVYSQPNCSAQWTTDNYSKVLTLAPLQGRNDPPVITALATSPDGRFLAAAGDDHAIRIINAQTGTTIETLAGHLDWVRALIFSEDGSKLFSCANDGQLRSWNVGDNWRSSLLLDTGFALFSIALHPDADQIATCGFSGKLLIYSQSQSKLFHELTCADNDLLCTRFSPDGSQVAVGCRDGHLRIWDTVSGQLLTEMPLHKGRLESLVYRKDGEVISTVGRDRTLSRFDTVSGEKLAQHALVCGKMTALMQLDSLLTAVATADNSIRLFCWIEQNEIRKLIGHQGSVSVLARNQNTLYSGSFDTTIRAWDIEEIVLAMSKPDDGRMIR